MSWKRNLRNAVLGCAVLLGGMAVWSAPARADSCSKVREERLELQQAIDRYGYWSKQAEHERRELRKAEANCGRYYYYGDRDDRYLNVPAGTGACGKVQEERLELQQAIDRYGYRSKQAEHERRDLRKAEAKCGYYYGDPDDRYSPRYRDPDDWR